MPIITFEGPELSGEKKREMIRRLTATASDVTGLPEEAFIVLLRTISTDDVGFGGRQVSEGRERGSSGR